MTERQLGPWRIGEKLGNGGNAKVYRVAHAETGEVRALKEINARHVEREPYQRFITEIRTLRELGEYPGVLPVVDDHIPEQPTPRDQPWLVMPAAEPIRAFLRDAELADVVAAIAEIAGTLARLRSEHRLAHRDLKPANLYRLDGAALVGDFGLVALPERTGLTQKGRPLGPAHFMPYEMLNDPTSADPFAADVYSLGKTLWAVACDMDNPPPGTQPATAAPHRIADYRPHPNAHLLDELVERATSFDPASRPEMADVAAELSTWCSLPVDQRARDMTDAAAAVRARLGTAISETERIEQWKEAAYRAASRYDELARPLNDALKAADPRASINGIDQYVQQRLHLVEHMGSPEVLWRWNRASWIAVGEPLPYKLRIGRALELIEDGALIIRSMIDLGLDGVMSTDIHWVPDPPQVPVGSIQQEQALVEVVEALSHQLEAALRRFAEQAPAQ
jgi:hypothetical protein